MPQKITHLILGFIAAIPLIILSHHQGQIERDHLVDQIASLNFRLDDALYNELVLRAHIDDINKIPADLADFEAQPPRYTAP